MASKTELAKAYVEIIPSATGIGGKISEALGGEVTAAGATAGQSLGKSLIGAVGKILAAAGIGKMLQAAFTEGSAYETEVAKVGTIADTSKVSIEDLKGQITDLSGTMGIAAGDLAEATYQAISAGQDTGDAVAFAGQAAKLAAAGFTSSSSAVDILTTALNAYGLGADKATHVSDVLLTTQNLGKTSVDELSASMGRVIPLAAAYKVNVENLSSGYTTSPTRSVVNAPDVPVLTVPELAMEGQTVPVSWTAATHAAGYTLERKASTDADWTQVYSGQALSSSETAGAWTAVQYRVKATGEEADSAWAVSGEIPVVSASALVISGQDGDLGTLVNDVPYSVSSDTGNQISLELRVNGALWTALEVSSGYAQSIPVIDLPTGAGTIDILATVQASTGAVSAARAWTYTKTPVTTSAGPCDVVEWQDATGAVKFPVTLAEAVRIPGGKTLDQVTQFPAQICTGSYVGTGTYGKDNPNTITLPFNAEIIWIGYAFNSTNAPTSAQRGAFSFMRGSSHGLSYIANQSSMSAIKNSFEENTCSWFANTAIDQLNLADTTYRYVALGAFMDGDDE